MITYRVPQDGYYQVSAKLTKFKPTGRFKLIDNEDKYWFQFWKPDLVLQEIYEVTEELEGYETQLLKEGESVNVPELIRIKS